MDENTISKKIAIIGGTGKEGKGLAYRWGKAGFRVIIGSRDPIKGEEIAKELNLMIPASNIQGMENKQAALSGEIVVLAIPYSVHKETIKELKELLIGKLVIDITVPLNPSKKATVQMPPEGSAALEALSILGQESQFATAFHTIPYENLINGTDCDCDVLVSGTSKDSRQMTLDLVKAAGFNGWDAGPIENSVVLEGLPSVLIRINRVYGSTHAGIRITGVDRKE